MNWQKYLYIILYFFSLSCTSVDRTVSAEGENPSLLEYLTNNAQDPESTEEHPIDGPQEPDDVGQDDVDIPQDSKNKVQPSIPIPTIYVGTDRGVFISQTEEKIFTELEDTKDISINNIFVHESIIYLATQKGVFISKDDGKKVSLTSLGQTRSNSIFVDDNKWIYTGPVRSGLAISQDGGETFTSHTDGLGFNSAKNIYVDGRGFIYVAIGARVCISKDGGLHFKSFDHGLEGQRVYDISVDEKGVIYAGTSKGLAVSSDDGANFEYFTDKFFDIGGVRTLFVDNNKVLYVGNSNGIFISQDGGKNFTHHTDGLGNLWVNDIVVHQGIIYVATAWGLSISRKSIIDFTILDNYNIVFDNYPMGKNGGTNTVFVTD